MMPAAPREMRGMGWRIPASILIAVGWLAFIVIWLFFFASDYSIYKNLAILFVSALIGMVVLVAMWIGFGLRMGMMYAPDRREWTDYRNSSVEGGVQRSGSVGLVGVLAHMVVRLRRQPYWLSEHRSYLCLPAHRRRTVRIDLEQMVALLSLIPQ